MGNIGVSNFVTKKLVHTVSVPGRVPKGSAHASLLFQQK